MRTILCGLIGLILLPAVLWADGFATFRIPTHTVHSLSADVYGTWRSDFNSSDNAQYGYRNQDKRTYLDGRLLSDGFWLKDSEPFRLRTELNLSAAGYRESRTNDSYQPYNNQSGDSKTKQLQEQWVAAVDGIYYPLAQPLGVRGTVSGNGSYNQSWFNEVRNTIDYYYTRRDNDRTDWRYSYAVTAEASIGWGRIRDVSAVYDVFLFEQRLQQCGALTRPLTTESKQKLVNLMYIRSDYKPVHDRPNRFFWKEIQSVLEQDGGLKAGGLDANALYRIAEPYFRQLNSNGYYGGGSPNIISSFYRERGYFVGPSVMETHRHSIQRVTDNRTETYITDSTRIEKYRQYAHHDDSYDLFMIGFKAEGSLPVGMRLQLHGEAAAYLPQHDVDKAMDVSSSAEATYLIADRWLASCHVEQHRAIEKSQTSGSPRYFANSWSVSASAGISYYLEDNLSMSLSWQHSQSHRANSVVDSQAGYEDSNYSRNNSVFLGFSYSILGKLTAPGITSSSKLPLRQN